MEIPVNSCATVEKDKFVARIVNELSTKSEVCVYYNEGLNEQLAREIGRAFRNKGYYARLSWHSNERFSFFYSLCVGKNPLRDINARLAWSEQL